jgi:hypothetical protein
MAHDGRHLNQQIKSRCRELAPRLRSGSKRPGLRVGRIRKDQCMAHRVSRRQGDAPQATRRSKAPGWLASGQDIKRPRNECSVSSASSRNPSSSSGCFCKALSETNERFRSVAHTPASQDPEIDPTRQQGCAGLSKRSGVLQQRHLFEAPPASPRPAEVVNARIL